MFENMKKTRFKRIFFLMLILFIISLYFLQKIALKSQASISDSFSLLNKLPPQGSIKNIIYIKNEDKKATATTPTMITKESNLEIIQKEKNTDKPKLQDILNELNLNEKCSIENGFLMYLPHSGFSNQLGEFINAYLISQQLGKILLLPPLYLGIPENSFREFEITVANIRATEELISGFPFAKHSPLLDNFYFKVLKKPQSRLILPFSALFNVSEFPCTISMSKFMELTPYLEYEKDDVLFFKEQYKYQYRYFDSFNGTETEFPIDNQFSLKENPPQRDLKNSKVKISSLELNLPLDKFHHAVDLSFMKRNPVKFMVFNTLFGYSRFYSFSEIEDPKNKWKSKMYFDNELLNQIVLKLVNELNSQIKKKYHLDKNVDYIKDPHWITLHVRSGDGYFEREMNNTIKKMTTTLKEQVKQKNLTKPLFIYIATDIKKKNLLDPFREIADDIWTLNDLNVEGYKSQLLELSRQRIWKENLNETISYVFENFLPLKEKWYEERKKNIFKHPSQLSTWPEPLPASPEKLEQEFPTVWLPFIDQMVGAYGKAFLGTMGSTFSGAMEGLHMRTRHRLGREGLGFFNEMKQISLFEAFHHSNKQNSSEAPFSFQPPPDTPQSSQKPQKSAPFSYRPPPLSNNTTSFTNSIKRSSSFSQKDIVQNTPLSQPLINSIEIKENEENNSSEVGSQVDIDPNALQASNQHEIDKQAATEWFYPTNRPIREYQLNMVQKALFQNTLICLPTGLGKTLMAAVVMFNYFRWFPKGKIVFMAPTKPLVHQQMDACYQVTGLSPQETVELTGQLKPAQREIQWKSKRMFFLTPQVMQNDLMAKICDPMHIVCLVVDEAHRATGNYAYCQCVRLLSEMNPNFRILGLTATPGSDLQTVQQVVNNLQISQIEIRTEESFDIRKYIHQRKKEVIKLPLGDSIKRIQIQFAREVLSPILNRLVRMRAYREEDPLVLTKYKLINARNGWRLQNRNLPKKQTSMTEMDFSLLISLSHAQELLTKHGIAVFNQFIQNYMKEPEEASSQNSPKPKNSKKNTNHLGVYARQILLKPGSPLNKILEQIKEDMSRPNFISHPKLTSLQQIILNHFMECEEKQQETRVMVFSEFRDSVEEIVQILNHHQPLLRVCSFIGQQSKSGKGLKQKEQLALIQKFQTGEANVLVCTCIGEEGLDIGEVDLIICFDVQSSPIRMLQRMGRTGRKREGKIVVLLCEGKEEQQYQLTLQQYLSVQKAILTNQQKNFKFYKESPRMIPFGYKRPRLVKKELEKEVLVAEVESEEEAPELVKVKEKKKRQRKSKAKAQIEEEFDENEEPEEPEFVSVKEKKKRQRKSKTKVQIEEEAEENENQSEEEIVPVKEKKKRKSKGKNKMIDDEDEEPEQEVKPVKRKRKRKNEDLNLLKMSPKRKTIENLSDSDDQQMDNEIESFVLRELFDSKSQQQKPKTESIEVKKVKETIELDNEQVPVIDLSDSIEFRSSPEKLQKSFSLQSLISEKEILKGDSQQIQSYQESQKEESQQLLQSYQEETQILDSQKEENQKVENDFNDRDLIAFLEEDPFENTQEQQPSVRKKSEFIDDEAVEMKNDQVVVNMSQDSMPEPEKDLSDLVVPDTYNSSPCLPAPTLGILNNKYKMKFQSKMTLSQKLSKPSLHLYYQADGDDEDLKSFIVGDDFIEADTSSQSQQTTPSPSLRKNKNILSSSPGSLFKRPAPIRPPKIMMTQMPTLNHSSPVQQNQLQTTDEFDDLCQDVDLDDVW